jgi:transcriptional regulator with XRE-family HTH domain
MLTGPQIRAARALLGWTAQTLADLSGVSLRTILRAEGVSGVPRMRTDTLDALQLTLEQGGVIFIDANTTAGPGVRLRRL